MRQEKRVASLPAAQKKDAAVEELKTAEVLSKVLLLAGDGEIRDPTILE